MWATITLYGRRTQSTRRRCDTFGYEACPSHLKSQRDGMAILTSGQDMLNHRGYIYTSKHEGWYSVSDEAFYPPSAVQPTLDPSTGRKIIVRFPDPSLSISITITVTATMTITIPWLTLYLPATDVYRNREGSAVGLGGELPFPALCFPGAAARAFQEEPRLHHAEELHGRHCQRCHVGIARPVNIETRQQAEVGDPCAIRRVAGHLRLAGCTGELHHVCGISVPARRAVDMAGGCAGGWERYTPVSGIPREPRIHGKKAQSILRPNLQEKITSELIDSNRLPLSSPGKTDSTAYTGPRS